MVEFEGESELQGTYAEQPAYAKLAAVLAYVSCIDLLIFVPIMAGVAVIGGVGTPATAPSPSGRYGPFIILLGMLAIGAWINYMWLDWLSGNRMSGIGRWVIFAMLCAGSAVASAVFVLAHILPLAFFCIAAFVPVGLLFYFFAAKAKKLLGGGM